MNKKRIELVLYPILAGSISEKQVGKLKEFYKSLSDEAIKDLIENRISQEEVKAFSSDFSAKVKENIIHRAKEIANADRENPLSKEAFEEFTALLDFTEEPPRKKEEEPEKKETTLQEKEENPLRKTGENSNQERETEYRKVLINFSTVTSVIAFFPIPIFDLLIIAPIQTAMVAKIIKLYDYDIEPEKLKKALIGTLGSAVAIKFIASLAGLLLPLAWVIHASITFAGTYALGILAKEYAEADGDLSEESMKRIWKAALKEGKDEFKKLREYIIKNKGPLVEKFKNMIKNINEKKGGNK